MSVIVTVEEVKESLKEQFADLSLLGKQKESLALAPSFWGIPVFVLPEAAFEGYTDQKGNPARMVMMDEEFHRKLAPYWENLQSGTLKLKHMPALIALKEKMTEKMLSKKFVFDVPLEPLWPGPLPSEHDYAPRYHNKRTLQGLRLCDVLLQIALKKAKAEALDKAGAEEGE